MIAASAATCFVAGIVGYVGAIGYPLFSLVGSDAFPAVHRRHVARITPLVGPPMLLSFVLQAALVVRPPVGVPRGLAVAGFVSCAAVFIVTGALQSPLHRQLAAQGPEPHLLARLYANEPRRVAAILIQACCNLLMLGCALR